MFEVIWLPEALSDLENQFNFLNEKNPDAASRAVRAILSAAASLAKSPERGFTVSGNSSQRRLRVFFGKYGYMIYYRIESNQVFILRIHHGRSDSREAK
jgi:plasmid stabilization system protein ParE